MSGDVQLRRQAAREVLRLNRDPKYHQVFMANHRPGQEIVIALDHDSIADVFRMIIDHAPPVVVACYWPAEKRLAMASFAPAEVEGESQDIGGSTTIGMLFDHLRHRQRAVKLRFGWAPNGVPYSVAPYALATA